MKKSYMLIAIGTLGNAIIFLTNCFINLSNFVTGLGNGICTGFILLGSILCFIKHEDLIVSWKRKLYKKFMRLNNE